MPYGPVISLIDVYIRRKKMVCPCPIKTEIAKVHNSMVCSIQILEPTRFLSAEEWTISYSYYRISLVHSKDWSTEKNLRASECDLYTHSTKSSPGSCSS